MRNKFRFIYKTTNLINNKIYVGQHTTYNLDDGYLGSGNLFRKSLNKYGKGNFKREILEFCDDYEKLVEIEKFWITELNSVTPNGYNISEGSFPVMIGEDNYMFGKTGESNPFFGRKHSEESKMKMSESRKFVVFY